MSGTGWPRAPLLIGFVLAGPMERYFVQTAGIYGWSWLQRPGVLIIGVVLVAPFVWGLWSLVRRLKAAARAQAGGGEAWTGPHATAPGGSLHGGDRRLLLRSGTLLGLHVPDGILR